MTQTRFSGQVCQKFRAKLDSYIDNELLTESNLEMIEHFERCAQCTEEEQRRRNVRQRLKAAVREVRVPAGLEGRVRDRLQQDRQPKPRNFLLMALAATLALCFGVFQLHDPYGRVLRLAFDDHVHCALIHQAAGRGRPRGVDRLPERYKGLADAVREGVPSGYALILAHECKDQGRRFVHLTFAGGENLLSLVITAREQGESLGSDIRRLSRDHYEVAAFETDAYLVYTVSNLNADANAGVLARLSPSVRGFLSRIERQASPPGSLLFPKKSSAAGNIPGLPLDS